MDTSFLDTLKAAHQKQDLYPSNREIKGIMEEWLELFFPARNRKPCSKPEQLEQCFTTLRQHFDELLSYYVKDVAERHLVLQGLENAYPSLYTALLEDAKSMLSGDPAAVSVNEVFKSYPGFYAIALYRFSHILFKAKVDLLPRQITEVAHSLTGIDIHPGATIGSHFCIDHGTGVVIGETTEIGNKVKLYQGVTLGALSVAKELAKTKRHPTVGDNVVIYAGATILGGETLIGADSIIGGNVWLIESIPANTRAYNTSTVKLK